MTDNVPLSRREFARLTAATAGALTLTGEIAATVDDRKMDTEYRFVQNHTPADYAAPTLVTFTDPSGFDALASMGVEPVTTEEPRPAAYATLTSTEAELVADLPTAEELSHSPGSNPFWRLGYYPLGVFPAPRRSVEFVDYEQMRDGMEHLADEHGDRLSFYSIGESPGHYNYLTDREDPKDVYVAEVTNDVHDDESFQEKEQIFYSLSLHGLERAGVEAGARFVEELLTGREPEMEALLDDVVFVFVFSNPDGWVAKHPQYDSGWQLTNPDGVPVAPFYERGNAGVADTNRHYPVAGWITTAYYPGEPNGTPDRSAERVPDAVDIVRHFRDSQRYRNLNYGADLHGMLNDSNFVLGLISQDQFDSEQIHELYQMNRAVDADLEATLSPWVDVADALDPVSDQTGTAGAVPKQAFDYAGIWDTLGYTDSGFMGDWMAHPPIRDPETDEIIGGGLGLTSMDFEMAYSHMVGANVYDPELVEMQVTGYQSAIRAIANYALKASETPTTDDEFSVEIETGGDSVAYITSDVVHRSSSELSFVRSDQERETVDSTTYSGVLGPGTSADGNDATTARATHTFATADFDDPDRVDATLSWGANLQDVDFFLEGPTGGASTNFGGPEHIQASLEPDAEYTFVVETYASAAANYEITAEFEAIVAGSDSEGETTRSTAAPSTTDGSTTTTANNYRARDTVSAGGSTTLARAIEPGLHSLSVHVHSHDAVFDARLVSPEGDVVREFEAIGEDGRVGGRCCGHETWYVKRPTGGSWTVELDHAFGDDAPVDVQFGTLASPGPHPDPEPALGYEQNPYEVDPFPYFEDLRPYVRDGGSIEAVPAADVTAGDANPLLAYDHAVVVHDDRLDEREYASALDEFVDAGGNLLLTDAGTNALAAMDNDLVSGVGTDAVSRETFYIGHLAETDRSHPLLQAEHVDGEPTPVRPIQKTLWKIVPLGYSTGNEAPMHLVDEATFTGADGTASVAGRTGGQVAAGSITRGADDDTGVHVVSSLLPPATQSNLHPFGLLDYAVSFLGHLLVTNALGFQQVRRTGDGEIRFGRGEWAVDGVGGGLAVEGSRADDASVFTAGQSNQVELTATVTSDGVVRDRVPDGWSVVSTPNGVRVSEDGDSRYVETDATAGEEVSFGYIAEAPTSTGVYTFGPIEAVADGETATASGTTDDNAVVGASTNTGSSL